MLTAPLGNKKLPYFGSVLGCNLIGSVCYNLVLAIILQNMLDAVAYQDSRYFQRGLWVAAISLLVALIVEPVLADYIPCICWGRNARFASNFTVGERVQIWGRVQSREYTKKLSETQCERRVAYEISISKLEANLT